MHFVCAQMCQRVKRVCDEEICLKELRKSLLNALIAQQLLYCRMDEVMRFNKDRCSLAFTLKQFNLDYYAA